MVHAVNAGLEAPFWLPGVRIERVEVRVPTADGERAVGDGGRGMDDVAGTEASLEEAIPDVQCVHVVVTTAEIQCALPDVR